MTAVLLRLDGDRAAGWLGPDGPGPAAVGRALEGSGADAVVLGAERLAGAAPLPTSAPWGRGLDPGVVATVLVEHTRRIGLVETAAPQRDHPFNLARRIASLDHLSGGRAGWLVGDRDQHVPGAGSVWTRPTCRASSTSRILPNRANAFLACSSSVPWTTNTAGALSPNRPPTAMPGPATTADAVVVARELWRSWPADAIVADRERGVFAESHRVVHIDHRGAFDVAGPLNLPEGPQGEPVVLWWWPRGGDPAAAGAVADAVVLPRAGTADAVSRTRAARFVQVTHPAARLPVGLDGVVVPLDDLPTRGLADRFRGATGAPTEAAATLRERLGLPARLPRLPGAARPYAPLPVGPPACEDGRAPR